LNPITATEYSSIQEEREPESGPQKDSSRGIVFLFPGET
jgi:hypothetical protein